MKLLILDFDGTIGDTNPLITSTMQRTLKELQLPVCSVEECSRTIGLPLEQGFMGVLHTSDPSVGDRCATVYRRIFSASNQPGLVPVFPHVLESIHFFYNQGVIITLASSRGHASLQSFVNEMHLESYVSYILGADDVKRSKPDPYPVQKILRTFSVDPQDTLVVGDTKFDILMGKRAGTKTCGVTYGNGYREELELAGADMIVDDFGQIPELLNSERG
jgi:phosphoglycolate phosphatase